MNILFLVPLDLKMPSVSQGFCNAFYSFLDTKRYGALWSSEVIIFLTNYSHSHVWLASSLSQQSLVIVFHKVK